MRLETDTRNILFVLSGSLWSHMLSDENHEWENEAICMRCIPYAQSWEPCVLYKTCAFIIKAIFMEWFHIQTADNYHNTKWYFLIILLGLTAIVVHLSKLYLPKLVTLLIMYHLYVPPKAFIVLSCCTMMVIYTYSLAQPTMVYHIIWQGFI